MKFRSDIIFFSSEGCITMSMNYNGPKYLRCTPYSVSQEWSQGDTVVIRVGDSEVRIFNDYDKKADVKESNHKLNFTDNNTAGKLSVNCTRLLREAIVSLQNGYWPGIEENSGYRFLVYDLAGKRIYHKSRNALSSGVYVAALKIGSIEQKVLFHISR